MTSPVMVVPDALQALLNLSKLINKAGVPQQTLDLVHLRVSQINGCAADLIVGEPSERRARADRPGDHLGAQLGLRLELHVAEDLRPLPPTAQAGEDVCGCGSWIVP